MQRPRRDVGLLWLWTDVSEVRLKEERKKERKKKKERRRRRKKVESTVLASVGWPTHALRRTKEGSR